MPLTAHVESLTAGMTEWSGLHEMHYRELALNQDKVPLAPNFALYKKMDANGLISYVTLRDAGRLVGYCVTFVMPALHYCTTLMATTDIFYVHPDVRGRHGGIRLFKAVKRELIRRGVKVWHVGEKMHKPAGRLFRAIGFKPIETSYALWLGA